MNRRRRTDEPIKNIHKETEYHTVVTDDGTQDEGFNCKALTTYPATAQPIAEG